MIIRLLPILPGSRLIDVMAAQPGHVIGEQLQRNHRRDRPQQVIGPGDPQHPMGKLVDLLVIFIGDGQNLPSAL